MGQQGPQVQEVRKRVSELRRNLKWRREKNWQVGRGQSVPGVRDSTRGNAEMSGRGRSLRGRELCKLLALNSQGCGLLLNLPLPF